MNLKFIIVLLFLSIVLYSCKEKLPHEIVLDPQNSHLIELTYYENGELKNETSFRDGSKYMFKSFYETGETSALVLYENGAAVLVSEYYKNGQPMGNIPKTMEGKINGKAVYYHENGSIRSEVKFLNDKIIGQFKDYNLNGELISDN